MCAGSEIEGGPMPVCLLTSTSASVERPRSMQTGNERKRKMGGNYMSHSFSVLLHTLIT